MPQTNLTINQTAAVVSGDLLFDTVLSIRQSGIDYIQQQDSSLVFDWSGVNKADSAAVALLLEWWRAALRQKKTIQFVQLPEAVQSLIKFANLSEVLGNSI